MSFAYGAMVAGDVDAFLVQVMNVYEANENPGPGGGVFDDLKLPGVACLLRPLNANSAPSAQLRAEMLAQRVLAYDPAVQLTKGQQVEINGHRWNPIAGTFIDVEAPDGTIIYRRVDVRFER